MYEKITGEFLLMVCLDTLFLIDVMLENPEALLLKEKLERSNESLAIASPTFFQD